MQQSFPLPRHPELLQRGRAWGLVRLTGTTGCLQDRNTVSAITWTTPGVVEIENDIEVG